MSRNRDQPTSTSSEGPVDLCVDHVGRNRPNHQQSQANAGQPSDDGNQHPNAPASSIAPDTGTNRAGIAQSMNLLIQFAGSTNLPAPNIAKTSQEEEDGYSQVITVS